MAWEGHSWIQVLSSRNEIMGEGVPIVEKGQRSIQKEER